MDCEFTTVSPVKGNVAFLKGKFSMKDDLTFGYSTSNYMIFGYTASLKFNFGKFIELMKE